MATEVFSLLNHTAGLTTDPYIRIFDSGGLVFDFNDSTFKSIGSATTPHKAAAEMSDMGGATKSAYVVSVDLAVMWPKQGAVFYVFWYVNNTPVSADEIVAPAVAGPAQSPGPGIWVEFGELGRGEMIVQVEINVKSTAGTDAQIALWLERNGRKVAISTADAAATGSVTVREHEAVANKFVESFIAGDLFGGARFEKTKNTPAFVDDRDHEIDASITINGAVFQTSHSSVVIG